MSGKVKNYKLKTNRGAKKRFAFTARGKVKKTQIGKRHNMMQRSKRCIRNHRGMDIMSHETVAAVRHCMPYACGKLRRLSVG